MSADQQMYGPIVNAVPEGIWVVNPQGQTIFCNERMAEILGTDVESLQRLSCFDPVFPSDLEEAQRQFGLQMAGGRQPFDFRLRRIDGSPIWVSISCRPMHSDGVCIGLLGLFTDISERRRTEKGLRDREALFRAIISQAAVGITQCSVTGEWLLLNDRFCEIVGYTRAELRGKTIFDITHPDDRETCIAAVKRLQAGEILSYSAEKRYIRKDGAVIWVRLFVTPGTDADKRLQYFIGVVEDITEQKRAETALRDSEERFRRVFEEGPLGLALVRRDYHFVKVNSALCQMVGYSEAELLQKSFVDITHPDDVQADVELAQQLLRGEKPFFKLQKRYVKKNGEIIWINLTACLIRDKEGKPIHALAMVEDITEVKRAQEEALARQKLESVGVLAGGIAHDFNNLLGGILASTELALTECTEGSAVEEELQRIKTTSIRGSEIVRELMIYGGEESPTLELVDISALVNEMMQLLRVSISKHVILKIELGQDLPPIQGNPAQIRQVVMNLVTNASEAIGERSGEIRVTSGKVKVSPESPASGGIDLAEGDYLRLEVFDTGRGMTPEVRARIFDPFFSTKRAGRGLGLAAVQGIIRSHGGTINVKSAPGQGSRFEILLPCFDQAMQETRDITATSSAKEPGTVAGTVLVVEDEEILRLAVSKMLRKAGFSVIEAGDGTTAANLFRANERKIDVVLLDMTLPGMSGREVLEELRRIQPGVKVILATAFSQASALSSIAEQHLWGYVRKPYQFSELTSLLRKALDKPRMSGNAAG